MKRYHENKDCLDTARRISRLDKWILALALLWAGAGITLLLETHPPNNTPPGTYVAGFMNAPAV